MMKDILNRLNFKEKLVEDIDTTTRDNVIKELSESMEKIINEEFNRIVLGAQKNCIRINEEINKRVEKDVNELDIFEIDDYKKSIEKTFKEKLVETRKKMIKEISNIQINIES